MSDAIEGADVMLYAVSLKYKESANVSASVGWLDGTGCECLQLLTWIPLMCGSLPCVCGLFSQCRLEANYAHQQELDMIPLMMQKDYRPQGWRKSRQQVVRSCDNAVMLLTCDYSAGSGPDHGHANVVCDVGCRARRRRCI